CGTGRTRDTDRALRPRGTGRTGRPPGGGGARLGPRPHPRRGGAARPPPSAPGGGGGQQGARGGEGVGGPPARGRPGPRGGARPRAAAEPLPAEGHRPALRSEAGAMDEEVHAVRVRSEDARPVAVASGIGLTTLVAIVLVSSLVLTLVPGARVRRERERRRD